MLMNVPVRDAVVLLVDQETKGATWLETASYPHDRALKHKKSKEPL